MKTTILLTYRPTFSSGGLNSASSTMFQDENGIWRDEAGNPWLGRNELETTIRAINKNSVYRHKIILTVDKDIFPNEKWLSKFGNVNIFKSTFEFPTQLNAAYRVLSTIKESILSLPDDEFVAYDYISDVVCAKYWDKYIDDAYKIYGDDWVYASMWVEPKSFESCGMTFHCGTDTAKRLATTLGEITTDKIWNVWRHDICCHSLTIPPYTENNYIPEKYFDDWVAIASRYPKLYFEEHHGDRIYGYWIALCGRNRIFKRAVETIDPGMGVDVLIDNEIANKVVVTRSFLLHTHNEVRLDDIEVEKIE